METSKGQDAAISSLGATEGLNNLLEASGSLMHFVFLLYL